MQTRHQQIERTKRIMDIIVYASSGIDIVIAFLVTLSYFKIGNPTAFLLPVNYMLSMTVVLTIILGTLLMYLKHYESILGGFLRVRDHVKYNIFNLHRLSIAIAKFKNSRYKKY